MCYKHSFRHSKCTDDVFNPINIDTCFASNRGINLRKQGSGHLYKKNVGDEINCTLLTHIGEFSIDNVCTADELCESLRYYINL